MAPDADPYRTLGLPRGASLAEVKKAYRRLAKEHHPDAAGEAALPRFLAIQAAYDRIVGPDADGTGTAGGARRPGTPRQPWDADPARADATHRAYGGRSRRARPSGTRPSAGSTGRSAPGGRPPGSPPPSGRARPERPPNKATLGSTSYDGAEAEPFEPDWGGASWYGTTSGTYWTLNPKEYADPRKHGPEYQARARRATEAAARAAVPDGESTAADAPLDHPPTDGPDPHDAAPSDAAPSDDGPAAEEPRADVPPAPPPTHTTTSWWEATTGPAPGTAAAAESPRGTTAATGEPARANGSAPTDGWAWLEGERPGLPARVARSVVGWVPFALGLGWAAGEATGCSRFAAACDPVASVLVWLVQVAAFVGLLAAPRVATVAAIAGLATLAVAVPAAVLLTASGSTSPGSGSAILGGSLVVAWVVGLGIGLVRVMRRGPAPVS